MKIVFFFLFFFATMQPRMTKTTMFLKIFSYHNDLQVLIFTTRYYKKTVSDILSYLMPINTNKYKLLYDNANFLTLLYKRMVYTIRFK